VSERGSGLGPFVFGVIVGALAGVLLAPARGEVTRRRLGRRVEELRDLAEEKIEELAGPEPDEDTDDDEEAEPSAREALEHRLRETRRRRRVERAARGRTRASEEDDEPVA